MIEETKLDENEWEFSEIFVLSENFAHLCIMTLSMENVADNLNWDFWTTENADTDRRK